MKKKLIAFRCPAALLSEIDEMCAENYMDRTAVITFALRNLVSRLGEEGVIDPLEPVSRAPRVKKPYTGRPRGRKPRVKVKDQVATTETAIEGTSEAS